ncbi:hypothetical protein OY671_010848, partial [Metschnikowia pulcherrima]
HSAMVADGTGSRHEGVMAKSFAKSFKAPALLAALLVTASALPAHAQVQPATNTKPMAVPIVRQVPDPEDKPFPGTIRLDIDATDVTRGAYRVTETIPVPPGATRSTSLYPQWSPGNHGPRGPSSELADVRFTAGGKVSTWTRDPVEVYAFHVDVPAGT